MIKKFSNWKKTVYGTIYEKMQRIWAKCQHFENFGNFSWPEGSRFGNSMLTKLIKFSTLRQNVGENLHNCFSYFEFGVAQKCADLVDLTQLWKMISFFLFFSPRRFERAIRKRPNTVRCLAVKSTLLGTRHPRKGKEAAYFKMTGTKFEKPTKVLQSISEK